MKKAMLLLSIALATVFLSTGKTAAASVTLKLWIAPDVNQEAFFKEATEEWNKSHDVKVEFTTIPASGSSEESILTAIASGTEPDFCTNIFSGFGAQLEEMGVLCDLKAFPGYGDLIKQRKMENIIKAWEIDGKSPILPIYSNPALIWWNGAILKKIGYQGVPKTYQDVYDLAKKYTEPKKKYVFKVLAGKNWWDRWFDFISYYYAASNGAPYIANDKAVLDNSYSKEVLTFISTMIKNDWSLYDFGSANVFFDQIAIGEVKGGWDIAFGRKNYPKIMENLIIGPMLTPNKTDKPYTFADTKGLVVFNTSKHTQEAWEFVKWLFSSDKYSLLWLQKTGMPPARGDLLDNPAFKEYYSKDPLIAECAKYVAVAVPPVMNPNTVDIQKTMTVKMIEPIVYKTRTVEQAAADCNKKINEIISK